MDTRNTNNALIYFYKNLKYARKKAKISQNDLAKQLNINNQSVSNWETGKNTPSLEKLLDISKILDVPIDDLLKKDLAKVGEYPTLPDHRSNDKSIFLLETAIRLHCPELAKKLNLL